MKEKKGVHPVTIAILLITTLLIIGGIIYVWMIIQNRASNAIYIQNVEFGQTKTIIYVQNIGNGTVTIGSVQIDNETFNIGTTNCTVASQETTTVTQGQTAVITINHPYNKRVHIRVICRDGTSHETWQP
jgi:hypothetical protein